MKRVQRSEQQSMAGQMLHAKKKAHKKKKKIKQCFSQQVNQNSEEKLSPVLI